MQNYLIEIRNLTKRYAERKLFEKPKNVLTAVDDVSLSIPKGKTLGLVGESGCGKSTIGRCILRLVDSDEGSILFDGKDILSISEKDFTQFRKKMQIVFQDPYSTLNPRMTVGSILNEVVKFYKIRKGRDVSVYVSKLLDKAGLSSRAVNKYPHEFSGGQRQRIAIARALAVEPEFIVCDEPVSALDVSIQSQIINLLKDLQKEFNLTYLFISHNLSVVRHISDSVAVMYLGRIVEQAQTEELFSNYFHPYTKALMDAIPDVGKKKISAAVIGELPSAAEKPKGCYYVTRCREAIDVCSSLYPDEYSERGHLISCHLKLK